jgi:hypothetical protein
MSYKAQNTPPMIFEKSIRSKLLTNIPIPTPAPIIGTRVWETGRVWVPYPNPNIDSLGDPAYYPTTRQLGDYFGPVQISHDVENNTWAVSAPSPLPSGWVDASIENLQISD